MLTFATLFGRLAVPMQLVPEGSRTVVFRRIYTVFLLLGTLVGLVVLAYMLHKAYRYRASAGTASEAERPELGELPSGGGGGRKLFLSFSLSAIIVVSLITWTYFTLLNVENPEPVQDEEPLEIRVVGYQFGWEFVYPNGHTTTNELRVPEDRRVRLVVTSRDTFHNFGIPALRAKTDAIPGQNTSTWFRARETGTYQANCYELCGPGHSYMTAEVQVVSQSAFQSWYAGTANGSTNASNASTAGSANDTGATVVPTASGTDASNAVPATPGDGSGRVARAAPARTRLVAPRAHAEVT